MREITIPINDETIRELKVGEPVLLSGVMMTGRDAVHKWMIETFVKKIREPQGDDLEVYEAIKPLLNGGIIYHCGPVVSGLDTKDYKFVAAGPTTSAREEPYQADVMKHFNAKGVIGKGGMGEVYRATDTKLKRDVAIKVLPDSFATDADRLARFQREAETLASLRTGPRHDGSRTF